MIWLLGITEYGLIKTELNSTPVEQKTWTSILSSVDVFLCPYVLVEFPLCFSTMSSYYLAMSSLLGLQRYELELTCVVCAGRLCEEDATIEKI